LFYIYFIYIKKGTNNNKKNSVIQNNIVIEMLF